MNFASRIKANHCILTEGAVVERLRRDPAVTLDPHVEHAGLVFQPAGGEALRRMYREYLDIGRRFDLPMIISPPTWRANPERVAAAGLGSCADVNRDCVRLVQAIRDECGTYARHVYVGGLIGCRGDAYTAEDALSEAEATRFHRDQLTALHSAGVDFLMAATIPSASEAAGIAAAMADCGVPYVLSFIARATGELLDGIPLSDVISRIDANVRPAPLAYALNCVHPTVFAAALEAQQTRMPDITRRLIGLQANSSRCSPEELDGRAELDSEDPSQFAEAMIRLHRQFGTRILGGCCGTDHRHIQGIAHLVAHRFSGGGAN